MDPNTNWKKLRFSDGEVRFVPIEDIPESLPPATYFIACSNAEDYEIEKADLLLDGSTDAAALTAWFTDHPYSTNYFSSGSVVLTSTPSWQAVRLIGCASHDAGTGKQTKFVWGSAQSNYTAGGGLLVLMVNNGDLQIEDITFHQSVTSLTATTIIFMDVVAVGVTNCLFRNVHITQGNSFSGTYNFISGGGARQMEYSIIEHLKNDTGATMSLLRTTFGGLTHCHLSWFEAVSTDQANIGNSYLLFTNPTSTIETGGNKVVPGPGSVGALASAHIFVGNASAVATDRAVTGDITISNTGVTAIGTDKVLTVNILNSNVTLAKIANIAASTLLGNNTAGAAAPIALTTAQVKTLLGYYTQGDNTLLARMISTQVADPSAALAASQFVLWLNNTPGSTELKVAAKDSGGTLRTATIPLT